MAKVGNHGQIIPRDRALLHRLYWEEERSLIEIGELFGVTHKSVRSCMKRLGIPTRPRRTKGQGRKRCQDCGRPAHKIRHATNGSLYGRHCAECRKQHRDGLRREYYKRPQVAANRRRSFVKWYVNGPATPTSEEQWITKGRHLLRSAKRVIATGTLVPGASPLPNAVSEPVVTSPRSCRTSSATSSPVASHRRSAMPPATREGSS